MITLVKITFILLPCAVFAAVSDACLHGDGSGVKPLVVPFKTSGIYRVHELAGWTISLPADAPSGSYTYKIKRNNAGVIKEGEVEFSEGKATVGVTLVERSCKT